MLEVIKNAVWNPFITIGLLLLGVTIMIKTRFRTLIALPLVFHDTIFSIKNNRKAFSLMCTSLGGTIGVGNAIGIAGAIAEGGHGAVFWMAIAGIIGMAIKYLEVYLSMIYSGPINYIKKGIGSKYIASLFSTLCIFVSFGMGNMAQVRASVTAAEGVIPVDGYFITFATALLFLHVTKGGLNKIRSFSEVIVPLISVMYIIILSVIIICRTQYIPSAISSVFTESGIICGFKWSLIKQGITGGFSKAIFSSEAGLGSAGFTHNKSNLSPAGQAKWAIVEVFADSLICIMTSVALLTFSNELTSIPFEYATKGMFRMTLGKHGETFYAISMTIFAFASLICWYFNGSQALCYLTKRKIHSYTYKWIFAFLIFMSAFIGDSIIIELSDIANGIMLTVNLCALWTLVFNNKLTF